MPTDNYNWVSRDQINTATGGIDGGPTENQVRIELWPNFTLGSFTLAGNLKWNTCTHCAALHLNCDGAACAGGNFLGQAGTFNIISAPLTATGTVSVQLTNVNFVEWNFAAGQDVPVPNGRCVQLASESFSATYAGASDAGAGGGAGGGGAGGGGGGLVATVVYPFLLRDPNGSSDHFPTDFAHLLNATLTWNDISTSLACFTITNSSTQAASVAIHVDLTGYSTPFDQTVSVPAMSTITPCRSPTPDLNALYLLSSAVPGQVRAKATVQGSATPILDDAHSVRIETGQTAFFGKWTGTSWTPLHKYEAVFSMPQDPQVQSLLAPAAQYSRWQSFGGSGYNMHGLTPMKPLTFSIANSTFTYDKAFFMAGESITLKLDSVACSLCTSQTIDFYAMSSASFQQFAPTPCAGGVPLVVNGAGSVTGQLFTITAPTAGWYYLAFLNNCTNSSSRTVQFERTGTQADTAIDTLSAIYSYLKAQNITYVNIAAGFFNPSASQTIRWPAVSLTDMAANCVDGSMLFSSVLEALQLEPVVVYVQAHAFMGVRQAPASTLIWPVETTMLGSDTFWGTPTTEGAFNHGITEYYGVVADGGIIASVDIKSARQAGVLPIPR